MRSGLTVVVTFLCCVLAIVTILTIGSFNLQNDEIERAMDFAVKQTVRHCMDEGVENEEEVKSILANTFTSQINSKNGTLTLYVLYADENIVDVAAHFSYKQINGSNKNISCRKTYIRDWEDDKEEEAEYRFINEKYFYEEPENGGLKKNSVWLTDNKLKMLFANKQLEDGSWENYEDVFKIKS